MKPRACEATVVVVPLQKCLDERVKLLQLRHPHWVATRQKVVADMSCMLQPHDKQAAFQLVVQSDALVEKHPRMKLRQKPAKCGPPREESLSKKCVPHPL